MRPGEATSLTLLGRLKRREPAGWDRFVYLYRPLIAGWCRQQGLAGADLDDVSQEVLTAVFTHLPQYEPRGETGSFRAWLRGVTRNKLLEWNRRRRRDPQAAGGSVALAQIHEVPMAELTETSEDVSGLYFRAAEAVRGDFSPQTWDIFWRTAVEAQAPADVAAELGLNPATVRMAKARVLRRIREEIGEAG